MCELSEHDQEIMDVNSWHMLNLGPTIFLAVSIFPAIAHIWISNLRTLCLQNKGLIIIGAINSYIL
jgi:hypothetical protein